VLASPEIKEGRKDSLVNRCCFFSHWDFPAFFGNALLDPKQKEANS
jgi:hypothetical protein